MTEVATITPTPISFQNALVPVETNREIIQQDITIDQHVRGLIDAARKELNYNDTQSFVFFGSQSQAGLSEVSKKMIAGVKNKDVEPAAEALSKVVMHIRGFSLDDLKEGEKHGFFNSLFHKTVTPIVAAMQRYEHVESQINVVVTELDKDIGVLMKDIVNLDDMYNQALKSFNNLQVYILAGEEEINDLTTNRIPPLRAKALAGDTMATQEAAKLTSFCQRLERRVHDFKLTKQATLQSLPMIMGMQDGDTNIVEKIQSAIINTIPIWQQRIAMLVAAKHLERPTQAIASVVDLTNELLVGTAEAVQKSNKAVRTEIEKSLFDLEAIRKANEIAIETLNETASLYQEASKRRSDESVELTKYEDALLKAMVATN